MFGLYYSTIYRNQKTGYTKFYIVPKEQCSYVKNGLLLCEGIINIYLKDTPICLEGKYYNGSFSVSNDYIPFNTRENAISVLEYILDDLTESQQIKIAEYCHNDLFCLVEMEDSYEILKNILKRSKKANEYAKKLLKGLNDLKNKEDLTKELLRYQVPLDRIELFYKKGISLENIKTNPYIYFVSFDISIEKAELFAEQNCDFDEYSMERLCGFVYDSILQITSSGNSCYLYSNLLNIVNFYLKKYGLHNTEIDLSILNLCIEHLRKHVSYKILDDQVYVYLNHIWNEENNILDNIQRLERNKEYYPKKYSIDLIEKKLGIRYNQGQCDAFKLLDRSGVKILTGPPGSGKTALIMGLIEAYKKNNKGSIKLAATTGMAAKVMSSSCGMNSETVNIMLNVIPYDGGVNGRDLNNPIEADFIIVDECSMLSLQLFSILVQATKSGSILLLVGDDAQLQSVEYGNVLNDLISSRKIEVYKLTEVMRQSGTICENAQLINNGMHNIKKDDTFHIYRVENDEEMFSLLKKHLNKKSSQILCPIKQGILSTSTLNKEFQNKNNRLITTYGDRNYYLYDKVIMTKTNYAKKYTNGDMGYVIGGDDEHIEVKFVDKTLLLDRQDMFDMDLSWCTTVHKSQGSEFDDVHIILPKDATNMMTRRILYTAVTRAKKRVFIYSYQNLIDVAIDNTKERKRVSNLGKRLEKIVC